MGLPLLRECGLRGWLDIGLGLPSLDVLLIILNRDGLEWVRLGCGVYRRHRSVCGADASQRVILRPTLVISARVDTVAFDPVAGGPYDMIHMNDPVLPKGTVLGTSQVG